MKRTLFSILMISALLLTSLFGAALAQSEEPPLEPLYPAPSAETGEMVNETPQLWFVELSSKPTVEGTAKATLDKEKAAFRTEARKAGVVFKERYAFSTLWNGLSIEIRPGDYAKLTRVVGVKAIYPVETIPMPEATLLNDPELATALAMTGADVAQSELGYTGKGIKVAVMDTGIDYDHPDLGGCFGPNCRVFKGWDFVGDAFNADPSSAAYNPIPVPDDDPDDCNGHGTHVAGIIGANGEVVGVAPEVSFGAYRVFGCAGSTTADIMMMAMERALADGMQVLNMSIGSAFQWPQYPTAVAADRLVNKGMVVVASIGNSGPSGLYAAGAPGLGSKVIGVASFDNSHVALNTFTLSPDGYSIGYAPATGAPLPPMEGTLPMARTGTPASAADACDPLPADSMMGKAVLIRRGTCAFHIKALNAQNAGAAAVVLYNNAAGRFSPTVAGTPPITIPVVAISDAEGVLINNRLVAGPVDMTWTDEYGQFLNPTGGLISSFSSYGLSPDLALKPDIAAPGGLIMSTYPLENGGYANISGTSMASPHVAGGVALLLQAKPKTPAGVVRDILQNSADPKNWWNNPALGYLDMVHRQGAGMLDIDQAILSTTKIQPGKLSLGESEMGPKTMTLTVENAAKVPVTYTLGHAPALSSGPNTFTVGAATGFAGVAFSAPSITVPAGSKASVTVTITANPALANLSQYGGYIVFTPAGGGEVLRVPYAGLKGDYQSKVVLTPGIFPTLGWSPNGASFGLVGANEVFSMVGFDIPYLLVHLDHQVRLLRVEIFDAYTGKSWQRMFNEEYVGRNSTSTGFFALPFDGYTFSGNKTLMVPDGTYVMKLSVLKALGDAANPAHWETWTSPAFVIDRP